MLELPPPRWGGCFQKTMVSPKIIHLKIGFSIICSPSILGGFPPIFGGNTQVCVHPPRNTLGAACHRGEASFPQHGRQLHGVHAPGAVHVRLSFWGPTGKRGGSKPRVSGLVTRGENPGGKWPFPFKRVKVYWKYVHIYIPASSSSGAVWF